jgi:biotin carboxylase
MKKIIHVHAPGGAPLEHALPRIAACGELHVLAVTPLPKTSEDEWLPWCAGVVDRSSEGLTGEALVAAIVDHARVLQADAIICLSEFVVLAVAEATRRLGMAGPGSGALYSRDKRLMRERWQEARVPIPSFRRVRSEVDLRRAFTELRPPLLLKSALGAGSVGHIVLDDKSQLPPAVDKVLRAMRASPAGGELYLGHADEQMLAEEIVEGTAEGWYETPGYGDYLSVEGLVVSGTYHPLCITSRLPTIPPFTELSNNAPCVMPEPLQRRVEAVARQAVDSLGLDTCGTHTEIKLSAGGELFVIESAARFGGCMVTKEIETVFGIDPISSLTRALLRESVDLPSRMLIHGKAAAASLALIAANASGKPWTTTPTWNSRAAGIAELVSPGSTIELASGLSIPDGTRIAPYDPSLGADNWAGIFFLTAPDAGTLLADCYSVLDGLEAHLARRI